MKGNTQRIKNVPCEGNILLCRKISSLSKGNKLSENTHKKIKTSIGVGFSPLAVRMGRLGYFPNLQEFDCGWNALSFGKSGSKR